MPNRKTHLFSSEFYRKTHLFDAIIYRKTHLFDAIIYRKTHLFGTKIYRKTHLNSKKTIIFALTKRQKYVIPQNNKTDRMSFYLVSIKVDGIIFISQIFP